MAEYAGKTVVFKTETDVNEAIRQYEEETVTHFVTSTVMKSFSKTEMKVNRFRWYVNARNDCGVSIPYDRIPFCFVGKKAMTCHMGEDRGKATKKKYQEQKAKEEAQGLKKYRQRATVKTKKSNCVAKISIKKVVKFPEFMLDEGKEQNYDQRLNNRRLMAALNENSEGVVKQLLYYVKFPAIEDHKDHPMGEEAAKKEPIDRRVHAQMRQLVDTGVSSYTALQKLIYAYVEKELFKEKPLPPRTRRRYFPSLKDVQNFMTKYKGKRPVDCAPEEGEGSVLQVWEEEDGDDAGGSQEDVQQTHQLASRSEQESFLTLLNAGMADAIHQEVVHTVQIDPTGDTTHHVMVHDGTQIGQDGMQAAHDGIQIGHNGTQAVQDGTQMGHDGTQFGHDGMQIGQEGTQIGHVGTQMGHDGAQMGHGGMQVGPDGTQIGHDVMQIEHDGTQMVHDGTQMIPPMMTEAHSSSSHMLPTTTTTTAAASPSVVHQQQIVSTPQQEIVQTSQGLAVVNGKTPKKPQRIGLVCRMKALSHELLDYSLLVKDLPILEGFVGELERMVEVANQNATLNPMVVQNELARNRRKRQGGQSDLDGSIKRKRQAGPLPNLARFGKVAHLSEIL